jgi:hypothetical protein
MKIAELASNLGRQGFYNCNGLEVLVKIKDISINDYDHFITYLISPVSGLGEIMVAPRLVTFPTSEIIHGNNNA